MAFVFVIAGLLMIVTGAKGTYAQFGAQVASDFTGPGNFLYWLASLGAVGSLGYVDALRGFSRMFMALILVAMVLANRGVFEKFTDALKMGPIAPDAIGNSEDALTAGGTVLQGPGLSGHSTSTGENTTSTPIWSNWNNWLQNSLPSIFGASK